MRKISLAAAVALIVGSMGLVGANESVRGSVDALLIEADGLLKPVPVALVQPLRADEKLILIELEQDALSRVPRNLSEPVLRKMLDDLRVSSVVGGRLMKRFWTVSLSDVRNREELDQVVQKIEADSRVRSVSKNEIYRTHQFNDAGYSRQVDIYTGRVSRQQRSYNSEFVSVIQRTPRSDLKPVRVAVIDTGISGHADIKNSFDIQANFLEGLAISSDGSRIVLKEQEFINATEPDDSGRDGAEPTYHGTKVQSLINAARDNVTGIVGLDSGLQVTNIRALDDQKGGGSLFIGLAMVWSAGLYERFVEEEFEDPNYEFFPRLPLNTKSADVINLSLGGNSNCPSFNQSVIDFIHNNSETYVVAAAGNESLYSETQVPSSPANCKGVVSVGASNTGFGRASYSNESPKLVTSTLGGDSVTLDRLPLAEPRKRNSEGDGFSFGQGTSFSAPLVSGIIAVAIREGLKEGMTRVALVEALRTTGNDFQGANDFCANRSNPETGFRACGTILNTGEFLRTVSALDLNQTPVAEPPPAPNPPPAGENPPPSTGPGDVPPPEQPGAGDDGVGPPGEQENPNPAVSKSVQFSGTVSNIDPISLQLDSADTSVSRASYSVGFDTASSAVLLNISIPGEYTLTFSADPSVGTSEANQRANTSQNRYSSQVRLDPGSRQITAQDPVLVSSTPPRTGGSENAGAVNATGGGGGGGGGALNLFALLGLFGVLARLKATRTVR
jgi:hypothetical protein